MKQDDKYRIKVLQKAFQILEIFDEKGKELTITQISAALDSNKPSTFRIVKNLESAGFLEKDNETAKYRLGLKLYYMGSLSDHYHRIRKVARHHLERLNGQCHETVHLAVLRDGEAFYLDKMEGSKTIRVISRVGEKLPAHCSGVGKILLSELTEESLEEIFQEKGLPRFTDHTVTDISAMKEVLAQCRKDGMAIDNEEIEEGLKCVAAPIREKGEVLAAVSISAPTERFNKEIRRYTAAVRKTAKYISDELDQD